MPTHDEHAELQRLLKDRLELVNSDSSYEGAEPTVGDHFWMILIGIIIPMLLMIGGWLIYV